MKKILLLLIIAIAGSSLLVTNNAFAVTIQPNVDLNNTQMRYTTSPTTSIQVTSFEIQPNHILLGSTYYDLNSTAGKVFATISSFTEGHDLTIHIDNSSLTDVNMFVLGQLKQVTIDGIAHTIQDRPAESTAPTRGTEPRPRRTSR